MHLVFVALATHVIGTLPVPVTFHVDCNVGDDSAEGTSVRTTLKRIELINNSGTAHIGLRSGSYNVLLWH